MRVESKEVKEIFTDILFEGEVKFDEPMKNHTSLRIGGPADIFAVPKDLLSLGSLHGYLRRDHIPYIILGGGTNVLVRDGGVEGIVISFKSFRKIETIEEDDGSVKLFAGAGAPLQGLVNLSKEKGYSGLEGLAGIPGTLGGAICGNAGAFGYEMKDILVSVELMDAKGKIEAVKAEEIFFGYRSSNIPQDSMLLSAKIKLGKGNAESVSDKIENYLRFKRTKQPIREQSAGCVFKNPPGLSSGRLIDEAGCKGMMIGDAEVSVVHANFFINKGGARASDFIALMEAVAGRVKERFDILLEPEIKIIGREIVDR